MDRSGGFEITDNPNLTKSTVSDEKTSGMTVQKWGGLAFFLMAVTFSVPSLIYLTGNLRDVIGPFSYAFADFLYGPVWAASLVTAVFTLREHIGEHARRRMTLALFIALLAAGAFVAVACIRSANRHYHMIHPELHLENSATVLTVWTTLVAGMIGTAWHFLGWSSAADRIVRLDIPPPPSNIERTVFGGWSRVTVCVCAPGPRGDCRGAGHGDKHLAGDSAVEQRVAKIATTRDQHNPAGTSLSWVLQAVNFGGFKPHPPPG